MFLTGSADIALHAKCAEPGYDLTDNKYLALNTFYQYPDASWVPLVGHDKKVAATLPVDVNDWAPVCYTIKDLSYFFQLGTGWFGGAEGTLWFALGGHKRFKLGTDLSRGDWKDGHIPLKEYFGQDQVDLRRLNKFELFDTGARDNFDFKGMFLFAPISSLPFLRSTEHYLFFAHQVLTLCFKAFTSRQSVPTPTKRLC